MQQELVAQTNDDRLSSAIGSVLLLLSPDRQFSCAPDFANVGDCFWPLKIDYLNDGRDSELRDVARWHVGRVAHPIRRLLRRRRSHRHQEPPLPRSPYPPLSQDSRALRSGLVPLLGRGAEGGGPPAGK